MQPLPASRVLLIGPGAARRAASLAWAETARAESMEEAVEFLSREKFDAAILDPGLPPPQDEPALSVLKRSFPNLPLLVLLENPGEERLAPFLRLGAEAILGPKDFDCPEALEETLSWTAAQARERAAQAFELEDARADLVLQRTAYLKLKESQKAAALAMQAMSECNRLLFILHDERVYIRDFCRVLVKRMGLRMAWAGFAEKGEDGVERLLEAGHAGYERNYLTRLRLKAWERRYPKSLAKKVLSTGEPVTVPDLEASSVDFFRVEEALRRGYRSVAILPLKSGGVTRGVLCLYSSEPGAFGPSEISYFTHVAAEMAHGVELLRREASLKK